ncbi:MAG: hypothetical protein M1358_21560 [Chloroflexi bacterium]|nr:hypothetical protein [Chloroflexota bacterium]
MHKTERWNGVLVFLAASLSAAFIGGFPKVGWGVVLAIVLVLIFAYGSRFVGASVMLPLSIYLVLLMGGAFRFDLYDQARVLRGASVLNLIRTLHPHAPRFLVAYPAILVANWSGLDIDRVYGFYAGLSMLALWFVLRQIALVLGRPESESRLYYAAAIILSLVMHGRLIHAFLGMAMVLLAQTRQAVFGRLKIGDGFLLLAGLFLASVSTGTLVVATLQIIAVQLWFPGTSGWSKRLAWVALLPAAVVLPYAAEMIRKLVTFYGGGSQFIFGVLNHGAGRLLLKPPITPVAAVGLVAGALVARDVWFFVTREARSLTPALISIALSIAGGVFGYSTGLMLMPGALVIGSMSYSWLSSGTRSLPLRTGGDLCNVGRSYT